VDPAGEHPLVAAHRDGRERIIALLRDVDPADADRPVPACPGWRVRDVAAHLAGIADDVLHGRTEGVATDPWTARQVDARRHRSLADTLDEWSGTGPAFEALLARLPEPPDRVIIDQWSHEQDLRGALGRPGAGASASALLTRGLLADSLGPRLVEAGAPTLRLVTEDDDRVFGPGEPAATLTVTWFELARALLGRRSRAQWRSFAWLGDPEPFVEVLPIFGPAEADLVEVPPPA
jgi:uncharacterized protein (TIGR03083 family)